MKNYKVSTGKGLAFKDGVIYEADETVCDEEILSFHQIKGMMEEGQLQCIVEEFAIEYPELHLHVTDDNFMQLAEKYYDSALIRGSIIYMMTFADGDVAVRCRGYK